MTATRPPIRLWYADGPGAPRSSPAAVLAAAGVSDAVDAPTAEVKVTLGWTVRPLPWLANLGGRVRVRTVLAGYSLARPVNDGTVTALSVRLSAVPRMIDDEQPDVAVVSGVRRGDKLAFAASVGWGDVLARHATRLVVELDADAPDLGAPLIEGNVVAVIDAPTDGDGAAATARPADDVDLRIGSLVAGLIPENASLQFGPGGIAEGIVRSLDRPVSIWSGLATDAMAELHERGLLAAPAVAAYSWGGDPVTRLAHDGRLKLCSSTITHDLTRLSAIERFVACNTAVQVGLDGAVNVERVGDRVIAAVGGHADFCAGASRSPGGLSIIAVRSTNNAGESTIVRRPDVVSTPRCDIDVVVTEHGVAWLRGNDDAGRAAALVEIAAPEHRAALL